ncbi:hypothetical protein [Lentzea sp.]|uniref:hypothetical protein n=1 Tax=Lentzea sp. TaxID=56099 RepID=UPI002ED37F60
MQMRADMLKSGDAGGAAGLEQLLVLSATGTELLAAMTRMDEEATVFHTASLENQLAEFRPVEFRIIQRSET